MFLSVYEKSNCPKHVGPISSCYDIVATSEDVVNGVVKRNSLIQHVDVADLNSALSSLDFRLSNITAVGAVDKLKYMSTANISNLRCADQFERLESIDVNAKNVA